MLTVNAASSGHGAGRQNIDREAHDIIRQTYRSTSSSTSNPHASFDAALAAYQEAFPHIVKEVARHAVAYIIATDGL